MSDIEQLLRDTLHGRAATIFDGPELLTAAPHHAARSRWLLVAAAVAAVLVAAGGVAVWGLGRGTSEQSGGGYARTCPATLPAAWKAAFTATPITVDGRGTSVRKLTAYGDLLSWLDSAGSQHLGIRSATGRVHSLDDVMRGRTLSGNSVDGRTLVLSIAPKATKRIPDGMVDDIVAVDLRTFAVRDVLTAAHQPVGYVVADKAAVVQDGVVYWVSVRGTEDPSSVSGQGTVLAFSLRTGRTRTVGHAPALLTYDDPRGVFWAGGGVPRRHVPSAVPPAQDAQGRSSIAVSDGRDFAWLRTARSHLVGWADAAGDERSWQLPRSDDDIIPVAVSGPFVFLALGTVRPDLFVLDTRSGAVVDSGWETFMVATGTGSRVVFGARANTHGPLSNVALDTEHLPELHCR